MAQRIEPADSPDDFPTPPWATRTLADYVLDDRHALLRKSCLEPACGINSNGRSVMEILLGTQPKTAEHIHAPAKTCLLVQGSLPVMSCEKPLLQQYT
jgi:hypothetical protein